MAVCNGYRMEQWKQIIEDCQKSGLSNKICCEQYGISEKTYYYWLRKLRTAVMEQTAPQIMELETAQEERVEKLYNLRRLWYNIHINSRRKSGARNGQEDSFCPGGHRCFFSTVGRECGAEARS